jgi:hypothetical protein
VERVIGIGHEDEMMILIDNHSVCVECFFDDMPDEKGLPLQWQKELRRKQVKKIKEKLEQT